MKYARGLHRFAGFDVFTTSLLIYSLKVRADRRRNALLKRRTGTTSTQLNGDILNVGFSADKTCENEAMLMKLDGLARNGSLLLMAKFGVDMKITGVITVPISGPFFWDIW